MADVLDKLSAVKFRDVEFIASSFQVALSHDLAEHKRVGIDGGSVEATGRNPLVFSVKALFRNHITFDKKKYNIKVPLFPEQYSMFMKACTDRSTGKLVTPHMGEFTVKIRKMNTSLVPNVRDGADVELEFVETGEDAKIQVNEISGAKQAAADLDAKHLFEMPKDSGGGGLSFGDVMDAMDKVNSVVSRADLLVKRAVGVVKRTVYRVNRVADSAKRVGKTANQLLNGTTLRQATASSLTTDIVKTVKACEKTKAAVNKSQRPKDTGASKPYTVPSDMSLAGVSAAVKQGPADVLAKNPGLAGLPVIPKGTVVTV